MYVVAVAVERISIEFCMPCICIILVAGFALAAGKRWQLLANDTTDTTTMGHDACTTREPSLIVFHSPRLITKQQ